MGFFKRFITLDGVISAYKNNSIDGLHSYFFADALIVSDECEDLYELYKLKRFEDLQKELDIIISRETD